MKKSLFTLFTKISTLYFFLSLITFVYAAQDDKNLVKQTPIFKQDSDWVKLTSDEWLRGDIVSMYDEQLEFDSDELHSQKIDWGDVAELRSKHWQSIRMYDGTIAEGYLVVDKGQLSLVKGGVTTHYNLKQLLSIAAAGENERDLWDGYINLGVTIRNGNTVQADYTFSAGTQRRSASSRFKTDYVGDYSRYEDVDTGEKQVTADSQRLTSSYDWFFSHKVYFRAADFEYTSDEFLNLDYRIQYGIALGYHLIDTSKTNWDVNIGPSYQKSKFIDVLETESDTNNSFGLIIGTDFDYEFTKDVDLDISYDVQWVGEDSGGKIHNLTTGLEVDLVSDFKLNFTAYFNHTENPKPNSDGVTPDKNDLNLVVGFGYDF